MQTWFSNACLFGPREHIPQVLQLNKKKTELNFETACVIKQAVEQDKKTQGGRVSFVIPDKSFRYVNLQ